MNIAVLSLTRDRLNYTKHCFATLRKNSGYQFDHYVLDQGSEDGTADWLHHTWICDLVSLDENVGISRGHNMLLDRATDKGYDVYVTVDNDCEVFQPRTLWMTALIAHRGGWIVSPQVRGLINTPTPGPAVNVLGEPVGPFPALGGIFRAMPAKFVKEFRFDETNPTWGGDEDDVGRAARARGFRMGYLLRWSVNHYRTTVQQNADYPDYYERKISEIAA